MRRPLVTALLFAAWAFPVEAGTLESAANTRAQPMQFVRQQDGSAEACGANCRVFVFASGMITADAPRRFETFARENDIAGATVVFDSDGGFLEGKWTRKGDRWLIQEKGFTSDGRKTSATNVIRQIDKNSFTWQSIQREVDGDLLPNVDEVLVVRKTAD